MTRILVVDDYDSFVFTIVGYLQQFGAECEVVRNDAVTPADAVGFDGVLVSPGGHARGGRGVDGDDRGLRAAGQPMLGICLGHQALGWSTATGRPGARAPARQDVGRAPRRQRRARRAPSPFTATRYHSLTIDPDTMTDQLVATAHTESGVIMAVRHVSLPLEGVQFHPESVLTEGGHRLLANWLVTCGQADAVQRAEGLSPLVHDAEGVARMVAAG